MRVSDIITRVRNIAGDTAVLQFTDEMVVDWINDGVRECATSNNLLQKRAVNVVTKSEARYPLPNDILKLHSIKYDGVKLPVLTLQEFDERSDDYENERIGTPTLSYIWAKSLYLVPAPDSDTIELTLDYIYDPPLVTIDNTDVAPALPVAYHTRLVDYCLAQVAQQDDDMSRYQVKMQEFFTGVSNLKDQPEYSEDVYPSISVSSEDWGFGYYG